jgi:DNA gyrase subunit A
LADGTPSDNPPAEKPENGLAIIEDLDIRKELEQSYLTYAMSVIVSRALPDVRDGLKPAQRRILVAMNDLNLGPSSGRVKCAKISGDTSGNYHPHGESVIYPTLVRLAQEWVMREVLIDKQGNFGSIAGLGAAAMRYTEARLSSAASEMLADLNYNTVDFTRTYDQRHFEPVVLPSRFPNLLVNGSQGIAVGMATSIPPHNLAEVAGATVLLIDNPEATTDELMQVLPGPDFPTGGVICGRWGIMQAYRHGRATIIVRAKTHFETEKNTEVIVVTEIPYNDTRDRIRSKLEELIKEDKIKGISRIVDLTDRKTPAWQVRLHIYLKRDADREIVLNQLFKYSPLQATESMNLLALVGNRPQTLSLRSIIEEFIRHRVTVIRRRTEHLLSEARARKHTVEGLLFAQVDIDLVIRTIRESPSRAEAKLRLQKIEVAAELLERALGSDGFANYQEEHGTRPTYTLSPNQAEAIVSMQLGSLANLERESLAGEFKELLEAIRGHQNLLSSEANLRAVVREEMVDLQRRFPDKRRTEISEEELTDVDKEELITEETMVVTLSHRGYIKRTPLTEYSAQNRGGRGITGAKTGDDDPLEHLFVSSTHAYLLFFTTTGKCYWQKVYDLPLQARTGKGRALVNLLSLQPDEKVQTCIAVRHFEEGQSLLMATRNGTIKKTELSAYSRPMRGGIIAIKLEETQNEAGEVTSRDELIEVVRVKAGDDVVLSTSKGMSIRFSEADARAMGRNTMGVKGISLGKADFVVGLVVAEEDATLLSVCENGYGKRTPFGLGEVAGEDAAGESEEPAAPVAEAAVEGEEAAAGGSSSGNMRYRRQRRGGKGLRDIKTTQRNGDVISTLCVHPDDHVLMISSSGKIQRIRVTDISEIGRNTQGVRIMRLDEGDKIASIARIPSEFAEEAALSPETPSAPDATPDAAPSAAESAEPSPPPPTE